MISELTLQEINSMQPTFLTKSKKLGYTCPVCSNGQGPDGTGITKIRNVDIWSCRKCGTSKNIIGWYMVQNNLKFKEAVAHLGAYYGITIQEDTEPKSKGTDNKKQQLINRTDYFISCNKNLTNTDYYKKRGLSLETCNKYLVGYDNNYYGKEILVIPTSDYTFNSRVIDPNAKQRFMKNPGGSRIFNYQALSVNQDVYVTEAEIDALSLIECGAEAIGLGGTGNINMLIEELKAIKFKGRLILMLDNDEPGKKATKELVKMLDELELNYLIATSLLGDYKDPNEMLLSDRALLSSMLTDVDNSVQEKQRSDYIENNSVSSFMADFMEGISDVSNTEFIPTGFADLDKVLEGGLTEGLYIIGAVSSLGKTTFAMQIADQVAQKGTDVLIFSLEMSRYELMAKSISRLTLRHVLENKLDISNAKTSIGITTASRYQNYSKQEKDVIYASMSKYMEYSNHLFISEGIGDIGVEEIKEAVNKHIQLMGTKPLVIIDYLQILAPYDMRATDKQNTDKAVLELKRLSRDFKIPIMAISSLNRLNYNAPMNMASFKESGAIEYSSDVLIGLQFKGIGETNFNIDQAKSKDPREIELVVLKNRKGRTGVKLEYEYSAKFNSYSELITANSWSTEDTNNVIKPKKSKSNYKILQDSQVVRE